MKLILQRVARAAVTIDGAQRHDTGPGLMILAGFTAGDDHAACDWMAAKAVNLRIFDDEGGNMNHSLLDTGGQCLVIPNFTLYANSRKGRRPSYLDAAPPDVSSPLFDYFVQAVREAGVSEVKCGKFGSDMLVEIANDGPVTLILDSAEIMPSK